LAGIVPHPIILPSADFFGDDSPTPFAGDFLMVDPFYPGCAPIFFGSPVHRIGSRYP
jgi:hypothetical protein